MRLEKNQLGDAILGGELVAPPEMLTESLPEIPGVSVAVRYRAAGEGNEVGGDFYDVFQVRRNAWWFVMGDVSAKLLEQFVRNLETGVLGG